MLFHSEYGVLMEEEGVALRGLFIINRRRRITIFRLLTITILAVMLMKLYEYLQALQTGGLCPAN